MFLKIIKAVDLALFPQCSKPDSISHYLLLCDKVADIWHQLRYEVRIVATSLHMLLSEEFEDSGHAKIHYKV